MPTHTSTSISYLIAADAHLLDTSVLVAAFDDDDEHYEDASDYVFDGNFPLLVPGSVLVESWGLLVGSKKRHKEGWNLLSWATTPGNLTLIRDMSGSYGKAGGILARMPRIDLVDAVLVVAADRITAECKLNPPLAIATYDTADFTRLMGDRTHKFGIFDLRSNDFVYV